MNITPQLQMDLDTASRKYHTDGVHFEYFKAHIWVMLNYGMSWIPHKRFKSLELAVAWADQALAKHRRDQHKAERHVG